MIEPGSQLANDDRMAKAAVQAILPDTPADIEILVKEGSSPEIILEQAQQNDCGLISSPACIWFHRDVRCDDCLLFETEGPNAENAVDLARGFVYDRARRLVATLAQQALQYESRGPSATHRQGEKND